MTAFIFQIVFGVWAIILIILWGNGTEKITQEQATRRLMWGRE